MKKENIKNILVPVDFSPASENALVFACGICRKHKGKIIVFNSYFIPVSASEVPSMDIISEADARKNSRDSMKKLEMKFRNLFPGITFEFHLGKGNVEFEILKAAKKLKCDYIVMGTTGAGKIPEFLVGSNTTAVVEMSDCPVIVVPENARLRGLQKVVFAADYVKHNYENALDLVAFAQPFGSEINLIHITESKFDEEFEYSELEAFKDRVKAASRYSNITFNLIDEKNVYKTLNNYLEGTNADMLAVSMRNRTFFKKIFSRSLTKRMVYHSHVPLLVFHT